MSSLDFTWDAPERSKQNGVIISYSTCVSHSENGKCFQTSTTSERKLLVRNLNASTEYFIRVLASTKVGRGNYSESKGVFTNGSKTYMYPIFKSFPNVSKLKDRHLVNMTRHDIYKNML